MLLPQSRPMWLSKFRRDRDRQGRERPRRRLAVHSLECLEDRTVLSSISVASGDTAGLYAAIATANAAPASAGTVNIVLKTGTYNLTLIGGELDITRTSGLVAIYGNGSVIDATNSSSRVLETEAGTNVTVQNLELKDGVAVGAFGFLGVGGGILNLGGSLSLNHVILDNDTAQGGLVFVGGTGGGKGGGLYTSGGSVSILNSTFSHDAAYGGGGSGSLNGAGGPGQGGGLYATGGGSVSILNSNFSSDLAQGGPGASLGRTGGPGGDGQGGGCTSTAARSPSRTPPSPTTSPKAAPAAREPMAATAAPARAAACTTAAACSP